MMLQPFQRLLRMCRALELHKTVAHRKHTTYDMLSSAVVFLTQDTTDLTDVYPGLSSWQQRQIVLDRSRRKPVKKTRYRIENGTLHNMVSAMYVPMRII